MKDIISPLIYNQEEWHNYGVHKKLGGIWSKDKTGEWQPRKWNVGGNMKYPFAMLQKTERKKLCHFI